MFILKKELEGVGDWHGQLVMDTFINLYQGEDLLIHNVSSEMLEGLQKELPTLIQEHGRLNKNG